MPPSTVDAVVLLGWMEREQAIMLLQTLCHFDPPLSDKQAEEVWQGFRTRAASLPERNPTIPPDLPFTPAEHQHAQKFLAFLQQVGARDIQKVLKLDPMKLVVHQYIIVTERSEGYRLKCNDPNAWIEEILPTKLTFPQVTVNFGQQGFNTSADIDLPHGEFIFGPQPNGTFGPVQMLRHITVMNLGQRMLLWAGYHRSYAHVLSTTPSAAERSALVALTSNTLAPPPNQATGVTPTGADAGLRLFDRRPALFADFFTDGLFMKVKLHKKRYQLQVRSQLVALDDNS